MVQSLESLVSVGAAVSDSLRLEDGSQALRIVADWFGRAQKASLDDLDRAIADEPAGTGDPRWDALLAGVAEQIALDRARTCPRWTLAPHRYLPTWWFMSRYPSVHPSAFVEAPKALANRGVFVHRDDLRSV